MSVEPSMEEILSSIKRIIAEEGDGPTRGRRTPRPAAPLPPSTPDEDEAEVLELSDPMPEPVRYDVRPEPTRVEPVRVEPARPEPARVEPPRVEPVAAPVFAEPPAPPRAAIEPPRPRPAEPKPADEPIISASAAQASRGSLEHLSRLLVKPEAGGDGTLEGLVRDMLRPMLRDWLDAQLPAMVETMVADEIARITGQQR